MQFNKVVRYITRVMLVATLALSFGSISMPAHAQDDDSPGAQDAPQSDGQQGDVFTPRDDAPSTETQGPNGPVFDMDPDPPDTGPNPDFYERDSSQDAPSSDAGPADDGPSDDGPPDIQ